MSRRTHVGHRDDNEHEFTEFLRASGIMYNLAPEGHGLDIYVFLPGGLECLEIKNPAQKPSARRLTNTETHVKAECEWLGIPYHVLEHVEELVDIVNDRTEQS